MKKGMAKLELSGVTKAIPIHALLFLISSCFSHARLLEASSKYIFHPFCTYVVMTFSSRTSVPMGNHLHKMSCKEVCKCLFLDSFLSYILDIVLFEQYLPFCQLTIWSWSAQNVFNGMVFEINFVEYCWR